MDADFQIKAQRCVVSGTQVPGKELAAYSDAGMLTSSRALYMSFEGRCGHLRTAARSCGMFPRNAENSSLCALPQISREDAIDAIKADYDADYFM